MSQDSGAQDVVTLTWGYWSPECDDPRLSGSISVSKLRSVLGSSDKIGAEGVIVVFCGLFPKNESCGEGGRRRAASKIMAAESPIIIVVIGGGGGGDIRHGDTLLLDFLPKVKCSWMNLGQFQTGHPKRRCCDYPVFRHISNRLVNSFKWFCCVCSGARRLNLRSDPTKGQLWHLFLELSWCVSL